MSIDSTKGTGPVRSGSPERPPSAAAVGWIAFAGSMMVLLGIFHAIAGLAGILGDEATVATRNYIFTFDTTVWGWIHLLGGVLAVVAGGFVFSGAVWARTVGVIIALGSAVGTFAYLPTSPVWAVAILAVDVTIIWALTLHGRDFEKMQ
jgi:hypothetical protein